MFFFFSSRNSYACLVKVLVGNDLLFHAHTRIRPHSVFLYVCSVYLMHFVGRAEGRERKSERERVSVRKTFQFVLIYSIFLSFFGTHFTHKVLLTTCIGFEWIMILLKSNPVHIWEIVIVFFPPVGIGHDWIWIYKSTIFFQLAVNGVPN